MNIESIWENALNIIHKNIDTGAGYKAYILKLKPEAYDEDNSILTMSVPLPMEQAIINLRYKSLISDAVSKVIDKKTSINIVIGELKESEEIISEKKEPQKAVRKNNTVNEKFTFDNFVVGSANRFAYTMSKKIAENPGAEHNPLFLYGKSGVGKTHLMHAIGNHALSKYSDMNILYVTSETFLNEFIDCVRDKSMDYFRHKYRDVDLLMVDDIQFFEHKESIQEEFFHTFNELYNRGNHIILTSDRLPQDLVTLEDRLKTRFNSGLTIDIAMVDYETRIAILKNKAEPEIISDDVYAYIAERIKSNIRELEGALARVISYAKMEKKPIDIKIAEEALSNILPSDNIIKVTSAKILEHVSGYYSIPIEKIKGKERTKNIAYARQIAQYLCFNVAGMNYSSIGKEFGNCDHTTVMSNVKKIQKFINNNTDTKSEIEQINKNLHTL